jgi:hypothetical protein
VQYVIVDICGGEIFTWNNKVILTNYICVLAQIGCRASPKWVLHTGGGELGPPLHGKHLWVIEKRYINIMNYYYYYHH